MKRLNKKLTSLIGGILFWLVILLIFTGCSSNQKRTQEATSASLISFERTEIKHAIGFDVVYHENWKELQIFRHYNDFVDTVHYALVQKGTAKPEGYPVHRTISIPAENIGSLSTTHIGMFDVLNGFDQLKGVETKQYIHNDEVIKRIEAGEILQLSPAGVLNIETTLAAGIDVIWGVGFPNSNNKQYQALENAGVPVLLNADWQELTLLGRAEWVKMLALLLNKEKEVNEFFDKIENDYSNTYKLVADKVKQGPRTITGMANGDSWHVVGGKSFAYNVLQAARIDYPWKNDNSTGSIKLDFETVYEQGLTADYWVVPGTAKTLDDILAADTRYADFKAFKNKQVFNIYGRYIPGGGNDYYESAIIAPHIVLKDVVKIFHPELLPEHELVYYNHLK